MKKTSPAGATIAATDNTIDLKKFFTLLRQAARKPEDRKFVSYQIMFMAQIEQDAFVRKACQLYVTRHAISFP